MPPFVSALEALRNALYKFKTYLLIVFVFVVCELKQHCVEDVQ